MRNFQRLASGVNVTPLLLALARRPDLWQEDTFLRHYPQGPFGQIDTVFLRFPERIYDATEEQIDLYRQNKLPGFDQHESIDYPAYAILPEARHIVMQVFAAVAGTRLGRVMINRMAPGSQIFPHADTPVHAAYYSRYHVVLQSDPAVKFRCGDETPYFEAGSVFWFNNKLEHEVINDSKTDRIHMIIDARCSE